MKRTTIDLDEELYRRVKIYCAENGTTIADVVRKLLEGILEKAEKRKRKS